MCNDVRNTIPTRAIQEAFSELQIPLFGPEGWPNMEPRQDVRITDRTTIIRPNDNGGADLLVRRWPWPGRNGRPVYNFRGEGRVFPLASRCLIPCDAFYEFTDPKPPAPKRGRKLKWSFSLVDEPWLCVAGVWRASEVGEAFAMLTIERGPDVAPYHSRQIVVLRRGDWGAWLGGGRPEVDLLRALPAAALQVERVA